MDSTHPWNNYELVAKEDQDTFVFLSQLPSLDMGMEHWQNEMLFQESFMYGTPLMESLPDPLHSVSTPAVTQGDNMMFCEYGNGFGPWNELGPSFEPETQQVITSCNNGGTFSEAKRESKEIRRSKEEKIGSTEIRNPKTLSKKTISDYFYMPITKAAKELNVGLTQLKKRCRELGIRRWPHRKLMSLQTLINNVQESEEDGKGNEGQLKEAIKVLESEKKTMEEMPDLQIEEKTKMLRQEYFKANYKKRKLMGTGMMVSMQGSSSGSSSAILEGSSIAYELIDHKEYYEVLRALFSDSSSNTTNF